MPGLAHHPILLLVPSDIADNTDIIVSLQNYLQIIKKKTENFDDCISEVLLRPLHKPVHGCQRAFLSKQHHEDQKAIKTNTWQSSIRVLLINKYPTFLNILFLRHYVH